MTSLEIIQLVVIGLLVLIVGGLMGQLLRERGEARMRRGQPNTWAMLPPGVYVYDGQFRGLDFVKKRGWTHRLLVVKDWQGERPAEGETFEKVLVHEYQNKAVSRFELEAREANDPTRALPLLDRRAAREAV